MPTRQEMWDRLSDVDVLVVGGGITGAGVARDAARRGLKTALVEMNDVASGTSSRSSKLVHGGVRYLEQYEFGLVFEAVSERRILMDIAPHLVNPQGFLFPVYKGSRRKLWLVNTGLWLYDGLSLFRSPRLHRKLNPRQVADEEPALKNADLEGAPLYYDCYTDDARLTLETALDAARAGATVATYTRLIGFSKDAAGRIVGARLRDVQGGAEREIRASVVVNATGPWTDATIGLGREQPSSLLRPTKGVHLVVPHHRLPVRNAVVIFHPDDGRVLFAIPWRECTYVGTTDTDYDGDPADVAADRADIDYLLHACAAYFPTHPLGYDDVVSTWAGLRPLISPKAEGGAVAESAVSREHEIIVGQEGLITIAGGKLTTFRRMAAEVVDTAVKLLRLTNQLPPDLSPSDTDREPLPGAVGWPADDDHEEVARQVSDTARGQLSMETCVLLVDTYGMLAKNLARSVVANAELGAPLVAGRPEIVAQVDWAVHHELATTVTDVLHRRTQLFYRARDQALDAAPRVADRMAALLGWTPAEREASLADYRADVALSRRWRSEP